MKASWIIHRVVFLAAAMAACVLRVPQAAAGSSANAYTVEQIMRYPCPSELVAARSDSRIAWVFNREGVRNIWAAQGPAFEPRQLTSYVADDGQELTNLAFSSDGKIIAYVRGGDHNANWPAEGNLAPDPASSPTQPKVEIWSVPFTGGAPKLLAAGDEPALSPKRDRVAFVHERQIFVMPLDGSAAPARLFFARGENSSPRWSPDGQHLAFVSNRGSHSIIGIFTSETTPLRYIAPSTSRDVSPRWSPDGSRIAFIRTPGAGGTPKTILDQHPRPWSIWSADAKTGAARLVWNSPATLRGSFPTSHGNANLHYVAGGRLVFVADLDGWAHLYSIPESGGRPPLLLTPGSFMTEYISTTPDKTHMVYAANTGPSPEDIDRRHVFKVPVDRAAPVQLTRGHGIEALPTVTGDGRTVAFIGSGARHPPLPMVVAFAGGTPRPLGRDLVPADFPSVQLVVPQKVVFKAPDGVNVHGQVFERPALAGVKKPGLVFVHGGPERQMLLGWHYSDYYGKAYALEQYLASRGYVVLSVNFRRGIGYGHAFHHAPRVGRAGASEYQDVKAAGEYLRGVPNVDPKRIGIWGGSYGGYLTALALARNSDIFATGVDVHGFHDLTVDEKLSATEHGIEKVDSKEALEVAWKSSPVSSLSTWKSPVLLIHGDDDRNVPFRQTVDLSRRLEAAGVMFEHMVLPDETHNFLLHRSWLSVSTAIAAWFDKTLSNTTVGAR